MKKLIPTIVCLVAFLSFSIVIGVGQFRATIEKNRIRRNDDWLARCQKIHLGMSHGDVVSMLGTPESLSQSGEGGDVMMLYKPPIPGFSISPANELIVSMFIVDLKDGKVINFTLGYE